MKGFYKLVIKELKKFDFQYVRNTDGSHELWSNGKLNVIVPFNCYSRHTANEIMKAAEIEKKF